MSRLIDADKLMEDIEVLKKQIHKITRDINYITPTQCESVDMISRMCECIMMELNAFEKAYKNIPTAFDVDKVVKQLEKKSELIRPVGWVYPQEVILTRSVLETIKRGGIDE